MPEVAICKENIVTPTLGAWSLFKGVWLDYTSEYFVQHLMVCLPLLIEQLLRNIAVLDWNR
jgi:hypothetical protein